MNERFFFGYFLGLGDEFSGFAMDTGMPPENLPGPQRKGLSCNHRFQGRLTLELFKKCKGGTNL